MKVIVCQRGSRHGYMVASLLCRSGFLEALYTDSTEYSLLGSLARLLPESLQTGKIRKLLNRKLQDIPREMIFSSDRLFFQGLFHLPLDMSKQYIRWGLRDCEAIYSFYGEDIDFLYYAKENGKKIIVDVMAHPFMNEIYANDWRNYPQYQFDFQALENEHLLQLKHSREVFDLADYLLVPSKWVRSGVLKVSPNYENKAIILPYGSSIAYPKFEVTPVSGRILFVGHDIFTKGLHHLAKVAPIIKKYLPTAELRIVGISAKEGTILENHTLFNFVGKVPLNQMAKEYLAADVLVMPSLSEGQSGAVLEALAAGLPVVITKQSGVDITHGQEGFLFDSSDYEQLPDLLSSIVNNHELRTKMSTHAKLFAEAFSMECWQKRLETFFVSIS